ncbi:MAG: hypothetical protein M3008_05575 [Chloroflexota bacterium]|nr:hypothetical protein [Chloroflexota bacterium]
MSEGRYAVIGVWDMDASRWEEQLVPMVSGSPGFVAGYWMANRPASKTYTTIILEDEVAAEGFKAFVSGDEARAQSGAVGGAQRVAHRRRGVSGSAAG